jgi:hypothetical protein
MGPNDVELVRVWTREPSDTIQDVTISTAGNGVVIVEAEAGTTMFTGGGAYKVDIVVRNLSKMSTIGANPNPPGSNAGTFGDPNWPAQDHQFRFDIPQVNILPLINDVCQVVAYLTVGAPGPNQDVSFAESPLFILTP